MEFEELPPLTYSQLNLNDYTLDKNLPQFQSQRPRFPPRDAAGFFETLPLELLYEILVHLDIRSLTNFKYVNRRAAELVESQPHYKTIVKYAQNAVRGILCVQTGTWITCEILYKKLFLPECEECGDFTPYLYIITCRRVCFLCFSERARYLPLGASLVKRRYGFDPRKNQKLPYMKTLPGTYSPGKCKLSQSIALFDYDSVLQAASLYHGSLDAVTRYIAEVQNRDDEKKGIKTCEGLGRRI